MSGVNHNRLTFNFKGVLMRKTYYIMVLLLAAIFMSDIAFSATVLIESEKIPASLQHIVLCEDVIFLDVDGELVRIAGIVEEHDGYYAIPTPNLWYCQNCKRHNFHGTKTCGRCGAPRPPGHE